MPDRSLILPGWAVRAVLREVETPGSGKSQHRVRLRNLTRDRDGVRWHLGTRDHGVLFDNDAAVRAYAIDCPRYLPFAVGDRIWVRETWATGLSDHDPCPRYQATMSYRCGEPTPEDAGALRWRSPVSCPRWASRLTLVVTDVRVQRVQDISEEDARAEGFPTGECICGGKGAGLCACAAISLRDHVEDYWTAQHGPDAWARNDWVVARTFRPHARNIDMEADNG